MSHFYIATNRTRKGKSYGGDLRAGSGMDFLAYEHKGVKYSTKGDTSALHEGREELHKDAFFNRITGDLARQIKAAEESPEYTKGNPHRPLIVVFIHGFNVDYEESVAWAERINLLAGHLPGPPVVVGFSWPSEGNLAEYADDTVAARRAAEGFANLLLQTLRRLEDDRCAAELVVAAHSRGNYLFARSMEFVFEAKGFPQRYALLSEALLIAADLDDEALENGRQGQYIPRAARRVHIYRSRHDRALLASSAKRAGVTGGRLGRQGPLRPDAIPENVVVVDCSDVTGPDCGHAAHSAYFRVHETLLDMREVIFGRDRDEIEGRVPTQTPGEFRIATEEGYAREWPVQRKVDWIHKNGLPDGVSRPEQLSGPPPVPVDDE